MEKFGAFPLLPILQRIAQTHYQTIVFDFTHETGNTLQGTLRPWGDSSIQAFFDITFELYFDHMILIACNFLFKQSADFLQDHQNYNEQKFSIHSAPQFPPCFSLFPNTSAYQKQCGSVRSWTRFHTCFFRRMPENFLMKLLV